MLHLSFLSSSSPSVNFVYLYSCLYDDYHLIVLCWLYQFYCLHSSFNEGLSTYAFVCRLSCIKLFSLDYICYNHFYFSVGGKDKGTRFLSYVDAINGFRHLLTQEDLDRALSLCTGLRGQLKNKFIVLSDDRVLPPYQGGKGKRAHPDDEANPASVKRQHHDISPASTAPAFHLIPGVSPILPSSGSAPLALPFTGASPVVINTHFPPLPVPSHMMAYAPVQGQLPVANAFSAANPMTIQAMVHVPPPTGPAPPVMTNPAISQTIGQDQGCIQPSGQVIQAITFEAAAQAARPIHGYTTVQSKKKVRGRGKKKTGESNPSRLTPSRLAKDKAKAKPAPMDVTSPTENYESCDESAASVEDDQDVIKVAP